jgi:hypothetical protein
MGYGFANSSPTLLFQREGSLRFLFFPYRLLPIAYRPNKMLRILFILRIAPLNNFDAAYAGLCYNVFKYTLVYIHMQAKEFSESLQLFM